LFLLYRNVVTAGYRFHDALLGKLLESSPAGTTVLLVSDHGFRSGALRLCGIPREPAGATVHHRPHGILCMNGPGIHQGRHIEDVTILDVTPTALSLFGLPQAEDMDGRALTEAFIAQGKTAIIPSWEQVEGDCGMHPVELRTDPEASLAAIERLVALGYLEPPSPQLGRIRATVAAELKYNLAVSRMDDLNAAEALPLLEELVTAYPDAARFRQQSVQCLLSLGRIGEAIGMLRDMAESPPPEQTACLPLPNLRAAPPGDSIERQSSEWSDWIAGIICSLRDDFHGALEHLLRVERAGRPMPLLFILIANAYLRTGHPEDSARAFAKARAIDGDCDVSRPPINVCEPLLLFPAQPA
jgi:hypothetical protein